MLNTTQMTTSATDITSTSRGFGRLAARTTVGSGPKVCTAAIRKARVEYPQLDAFAFLDGFQAERRDLRAR